MPPVQAAALPQNTSSLNAAMASRKSAIAPAPTQAVPAGPTAEEKRKEAFDNCLQTAIGPLGPSWRQRITAEVGDPRLAALVYEATGQAALPFDDAVVAFDSVHTRFADHLVRRVAERPIQVPLVTKATLRGWRTQYGVAADAPVTPDEVLFWFQYSAVGACRTAYNPMDQAAGNQWDCSWTPAPTRPPLPSSPLHSCCCPSWLACDAWRGGEALTPAQHCGSVLWHLDALPLPWLPPGVPPPPPTVLPAAHAAGGGPGLLGPPAPLPGG